MGFVRASRRRPCAPAAAASPTASDPRLVRETLAPRSPARTRTAHGRARCRGFLSITKTIARAGGGPAPGRSWWRSAQAREPRHRQRPVARSSGFNDDEASRSCPSATRGEGLSVPASLLLRVGAAFDARAIGRRSSPSAGRIQVLPRAPLDRRAQILDHHRRPAAVLVEPSEVRQARRPARASMSSTSTRPATERQRRATASSSGEIRATNSCRPSACPARPSRSRCVVRSCMVVFQRATNTTAELSCGQ